MAEDKEKPDGDVLDQSVIASLRELGGDDGGALLRELIGLFLADSPPRLNEIESAMTAGDAKGVEKAAHALKSSCANLGATRMAELCRQLEQSGRSGALDSARETVLTSKAEFERVTRELTRLSHS